MRLRCSLRLLKGRPASVFGWRARWRRRNRLLRRNGPLWLRRDLLLGWRWRCRPARWRRLTVLLRGRCDRPLRRWRRGAPGRWGSFPPLLGRGGRSVGRGCHGSLRRRRRSPLRGRRGLRRFRLFLLLLLVRLLLRDDDHAALCAHIGGRGCEGNGCHTGEESNPDFVHGILSLERFGLLGGHRGSGLDLFEIKSVLQNMNIIARDHGRKMPIKR